jgi:hypothetical protein
MTIRRRFLFLGAFALLLCPIAQAQLRNHDAFFGYSRASSNLFYPNVGGLNGWDAALHIHVMPFLGVEGDVAHYGLGADASTPKTTTYMVGPRVTVKALGIGVFVHGLVGGEHSANSAGVNINAESLTYAIGGGVDVPIFPFFAWRIAGDRIASPTLSPSDSNKARFNTGLVFRF